MKNDHPKRRFVGDHFRLDSAPTVARRVTLNLFSRDDGDYVDVLGSAVMIAPYLAITARHVVKMFNENFARAQREGRTRGAQHVYASQEWAPGSVAVLSATMWYSPPESDFAVLRLVPIDPMPEGWQWLFAGLDVILPRVGDEVLAFGYSPVEVAPAGDSVAVLATGRLETGVVREILNPIPGNSMHGWPRFQTNALFSGGMSGGAVFSSNGLLIGIASSSMPARNEEEEHASFVPLLWPAMNIEVHRPGRTPGDSLVTLLQLAEEGLLTAIGHELIYTWTTADGYSGIGMHSAWHNRYRWQS